ncbi:MAG: flagellar filament capping protein FliD [Phycisphaeraceae bacterium]|nr:flagellar filament capping protein FliD [Phycisphaeraceae bacterium]
MSGITSTTGLFSGINSGQLIEQLLQIEARPKTLAQQRLIQIQAQQAAFLDLNTRVGALKTLATSFSTKKIFQSAVATSSNPSVLSAAATTGALPGNYTFIVDRVVSSQQVLSRGFADRNISGLGASQFIFESDRGRLDRDISLSDLNGGAGVARGKITVTDSAGTAVTVDLSRTATVGEVLEAINAAGNGRFTASAQGDHLVLSDTAGGAGQLVVANAPGYDTATSLGIAGTSATTPAGKVLTGSRIHYVGGGTSLSAVRDGNGVRFNAAAGTSTPDLAITTRDGASVLIDLGDMYDGQSVKIASASSSIQDVITRINTQSNGTVTAAISADGTGLTLTDNTGGTGNFVVANAGTGNAASTAATDLGLEANVASSTITGARVVAGINSTLASNLNGGLGLAAGDITITDRTGASYSFTVPTGGSVSDIIDAINTATTAGGSVKVRASLDATGTGLKLTDSTGGSGNLIVSGGGATALGLATDPAGVASATFSGQRLQHRYIALGTSLSTLNGGSGIGTGSFEITGSDGRRATITISESTRTIGDVLAQINGATLNVEAVINANGDGILIRERAGETGGSKIRITDASGTVAKSLNIAGEAAGTGDDNTIDGSYERKVAFTAADTLDTIAQKINSANINVSAAVISDGNGATPFRLSLSSKLTGKAGRFTLDTGGVDLSFVTLSRGSDARMFYGVDDPARGVLLESTTNTFDGIVPGVRLDAVSTSTTPVSLTVSRDTDAIVTAVQEFVDKFNEITARIATYTKYDEATKKKGTLLGDSTAVQLRSSLFSSIQAKAIGVSGTFQFLSQVGIKIGSGASVTLDTDALRAALNQDAQAVADLFSAKVAATPPTNPTTPTPDQPVVVDSNPTTPTYTTLGVMEQIGRLAESYVDIAAGLFKSRADGFEAQIKLQNDRIADIDKKLENKRIVLSRQFLQMEQAIASLQSQQSSLGGLAALAAR